MNTETIKIYSDGSCIWNPWPWGYASILFFWENSKTIVWSQVDTTNNRMELKSVIEALKLIKSKKYNIEIYSDSKYVNEWITQYIENWKKNWWKSANKQPVKNKDLWQELDALTVWMKIQRNWIKWHADNHLNNLADKLARKEAEKLMK